MDEFSDGRVIFKEPQDVVWSKIDDPNSWEIPKPYGYFRYDIQLDAWVRSKEDDKGVAFYATPPKREWVGLTDEEGAEIWGDAHDLDWKRTVTPKEIVKRIEAKLKEKNTCCNHNCNEGRDCPERKE
jgi:hypothetical protein